MEEIYAKAIEMLKKGSSKEEVLLYFAEHKEQLAPLLEISSALLLMPKNIPPKPAMQRKYALAPSKNFWLNWIHVSKFAGVSMSVMLLVSVIAGTGYAAFQSGPGQTLFAVKKSAEKLPLLLAQNDQAKANIQVAIAQQRLNEAQEIFSNPNSNQEQKTAALNELSDQTNTAIAQVSSAAQSEPQPASSKPLLSSLQNLNNQQKNLIAQIHPDNQINQTASSALASLDQASEKINQIKQLVAITTSSQSLVQLSSNPNAVAVLGIINQISNTQITVEKTSFIITPQTIIQDSNGNPLKISDLALKTKVNIVGNQTQGSIMAEEISVTVNLDDSATGIASTTNTSTPEVKGTSTQISSTDILHTSTSSSISAKKTSDSSSTEDSTTTVQTDPGQASGSFIMEDPAPKYIK